MKNHKSAEIVAFLSLFTIVFLLFSSSVIDVSVKTFHKTIKPYSYLVDTSGCRIRNFDPFHPSVRQFYQNLGEKKCDGKPSFIHIDKYNAIRVNQAILRNTYGLHPKHVSCYYKEILRGSTETVRPDSGFRYSPERKVWFGVPIDTEYFSIRCQWENLTVLEDFVFVPILKIPVEARAQKAFGELENETERLNVIIFGLDSVSRLNFLRYFRKTGKLLKQLGALEFKGFNKVGDNTYPNLNALLTGIPSVEFRQRENTRFWDDVNFIWKSYLPLGYRTFFQEDFPKYNLYTYKKKGFYEQPTDYYFRPAALALEQSDLKRISEQDCIGRDMEINRYLHYARDFAVFMKDRTYFMFSWLAQLTHNDLTLSSYADKPASDFLQSLHVKGVLNKTFMIFMSDHGIRFGDIRTTYIGKMEENLPFLFMIFPKWFSKRYPEVYGRLKVNQRRLITPFDLHATLLDFSTYPKFSIPSTRYGISLFREVPENRTCMDASISVHWCACHSHTDVTFIEPISNHLGEFVIFQINLWVVRYAPRKCALLRLTRIISIQKVVHHDEKSPTSKANFTDYVVMVVAQPGGGVFESTIRVDERNFTTVDDISRLNMYRNQSLCVDDYWLQKFCYCLNL